MSDWARGIIDAALDSGLKVVDYDGVLQPQIFLLPTRSWHNPPFVDMVGREVFVQPVLGKDYTTAIHLRLEGFWTQVDNPDDTEDSIYFLYYMPLPKDLTSLRRWINDLTSQKWGTKFVPVTTEGYDRLEKISTVRWSEPVQLKIVDGELLMREMKQTAGLETDGYEAWTPMDGLNA